MKQSKNGICKIFLVSILFLNTLVFSKEISIEAGIYDFTDEESKVIFKLAPAFLASVDLYEVSRLSLNLSVGIAVATAQYYKKTYKLIMVPAYLTLQYNLLDKNSRFQPYVGGGFTLNGKIDKNPYYSDDEYELSYGYLVQAGVSILFKKFIITGNMKYNIIIPSKYVESPNASGIISTVGISIPFGKNKITE